MPANFNKVMVEDESFLIINERNTQRYYISLATLLFKQKHFLIVVKMMQFYDDQGGRRIAQKQKKLEMIIECKETPQEIQSVPWMHRKSVICDG